MNFARCTIEYEQQFYLKLKFLNVFWLGDGWRALPRRWGHGRALRRRNTYPRNPDALKAGPKSVQNSGLATQSA